MYGILLYMKRDVDMKSAREIIKELREDRDIKQVDLAKYLGIKQQLYSLYETQKDDLPTWLVLALSEYYRVSTDYILSRTKCMQGVDGLNQPLTEKCTTGKLISAVLVLSEEDRKKVIEYVELLRLRRRMKRHNEKNGGE